MSTSSSSSTNRSSQEQRDNKDRDRSRYRIGDVTRLTGLSADTLRYYEKIDLLRPVSRLASGVRVYDEGDLSRLRFIQRAKAMNFSLDEIARLLEMREDPLHARDDVRELAHRKLEAVESHLEELATLRKELTLLINLCRGAEAGCPIIEDLDSRPRRKKPKRG
ncbi:heavy metal-responsive transcriptional regulator [Sulfuriflexus sp.]|uniref:heavy metal-responsive transcriptional regulator n=1 Tax=Sulfuriflexus sp. TaxID=2015443 RepID=UPI0028CE7464|nr:heavy metal-responsive transcriptional regulator [Sulfuriflexus sp.]MDT8404676.1 heavy metal-responsive transcriptional regulator [Sulfuriflexus sp.]